MSGRFLSPLLATALTLAAATPPAAAATPPAAAETPRREGLVLGVAMGAATLNAGFGGFNDGNGAESVGSVAADLQFGGMITRRIALLFHLNLARGTDGGGVQYLHAAALVGFRLFATRVFWFEIALGTSGYQERDTLFGATLEERSRSFAYLFGLGVEVYQGKRFTIDVRANLGGAEYAHDFSATYFQGLIGLNWY